MKNIKKQSNNTKNNTQTKQKNTKKNTKKKKRSRGVPGADLLPNGLSVEGRQEEVHACRGADVVLGALGL